MAKLAFTLPNPDATGACRMALSFALACRSRGHSVKLLHGMPPADQPTVLDDFRQAGIPARLHPGFGPKTSLGVLRWLRSEAREADALVSFFVATDTKYLAPVSRIVGIPHIASVQNDLIIYGNALVRPLKSAVLGLIYRRGVDLAACTSTRIRETLIERYGMPAERTRLLPNSIDTQVAAKGPFRDRSEVRAELGIGEKDFLWVQVGRLDPQKGQDVLLDAFHAKPSGPSPSVLCIVGGETANSEASRAYAQGLRQRAGQTASGDEVRFLGWRSDVPSLLRAADAYVHAARWEGAPLAVLEAMAADLPVIYSDCAGRMEGFEEGVHGHCTPAGDAGALTRAITSIETSAPERRAQMGRDCAVLVRKHFDVSINAGRFVDMVEEVLAARRAGAVSGSAPTHVPRGNAPDKHPPSC
jgi:glycosyltransferase involved in cell wall biosynthesis